MKSNLLWMFWIQIQLYLSYSEAVEVDCDRIVRVFRHLKDGERGIPELDIQDPMQIPDFNVEKTSPKVVANFKNSSVHGISDFIISRIHVDLVRMKVNVALNFTRINVRGEYFLRANTFLMTIQGEGPFWMNISDVYITCTVELTSDEAGRFRVEDVITDLDVKELKINFENLGTLGNFANAVINALSSSLILKVKPTVISQAKEQITSKGNEFFETLPPQSLLFSPLFAIDVALLDVCQKIKDLGLDPKDLPILEYQFEKKILFVTFYGSVKFFDGYVTGLSTLHRTGEVEFLYTNGSLESRVRLGFDELEAGYKMAVNFQGLESLSGVHFLVEDVDVELVMALEDESLPPTVREFRFVDVRQMTADVDGFGSLDSIFEFSSNTFVNAFKYQLTEVIETDIRDVIQEKLEGITLSNTCRSLMKVYLLYLK